MEDFKFITNVPPEPENENSTMERFSAGLALQNPLSYAFHPEAAPTEYHAPIKGYRPMDDPQVQQEISRGYEPDLFLRSESPEASNSIIEHIRANERLRGQAAGGAGLSGEMFGAIFDPMVLAPAFASGGLSIASRVAVEVAAEGLRETILHTQQPLRTKVESAINIGLVGTITAGGGVVASRMARGRPGRPGEATENMARDLGADPDAVTRGGTGEPSVSKETPDEMAHSGDAWETSAPSEEKLKDQSVGAAQAAIDNTPQSSVGEVQSTGWFGKVVSKTSPAGDIIHNSFSTKAKETTKRLVDTIYRYAPGVKAYHSVESRIKQADGDIASMENVFKSEHKKYKERGGTLKENEFDIQVSIAMRSGDIHEIAEVQATAKFFRKFDENYFDQAEKLGLYGEKGSLKRVRSHLQRIYDRRKILDGYQGLRRKIAGKMMNVLAKDDNYVLIRYLDSDVGYNQVRAVHSRDLPRVQEAFDNVKIITGKEIAEWEEEALADVADEIAGNIISRMLDGDIVDITSLDNVIPKAGSLHERSLNMLSDEELFPYMVQDARTVMAVTSRQMTREIEMAKEFGSTDMKKAIAEIKEDYEKLTQEAKSPKERQKLTIRQKRDIKNIEGMRDLLMGTYGRPQDPTSFIVKFGLGARTLAMLSYGANITTSSLSDMVAPALRYGFEPFSEGFRVLTSNSSKEYLEYVRHLGIAVEAITNQRALALSDMAFTNKWSHSAMRAFGKYTGLNFLTDTSQALNAIGTSSMWLKWAKGYGKLSKKKRAKLLDVGLDEDVIGRINSQTEKFGKTKDGVTLPETHLWDDKNAAMQFENALRKEVHSSTLIPGKGDVPLFLKTETGRFFGQFMSFMLSSQQRWILAGVQRADAEFLTGMLALTATGMLVSYGKDSIRGVDTSDREWYDWMMEGMDRGGALGLFAMPVDWGRMIASDSTPSRFVGRSMMESFVVPPGAKYIESAMTPLINVMRGDELSERDSWRLIRAVPLLNSFHFVDAVKTYGVED